MPRTGCCLHSTLAIPTHPSSWRVCSTEIRIIALTRSNAAVMRLVILTALEGTAKNSNVSTRLANAKLAKLKGKNPEPRVWKPGGVTNVDTRRMIHHAKAMRVKKMVKYLVYRTLQRL